MAAKKRGRPSTQSNTKSTNKQKKQLYAIICFALAIFLFLYSEYKKHTGNVVSMYAIVYSIGRFSVEFLRDDPRGSIGVLTTSQFIAIMTFILGITLFVMCKRKGRSESVEKK